MLLKKSFSQTAITPSVTPTILGKDRAIQMLIGKNVKVYLTFHPYTK